MTSLIQGLYQLRSFHPPELSMLKAGEKKRYQMAKTDEWELILNHWGPGAKTQIHDHAESDCWTRIIEGSLVESTFEKATLKEVSKLHLRASSEVFICDELGVHSLMNTGTDQALSLHLYAKPIVSNEVWDEARGLWVLSTPKLDQLFSEEIYENAAF